jgi:hypothetical protein
MVERSRGHDHVVERYHRPCSLLNLAPPSRILFAQAKAGRLAAYRHVCDACYAQVEGMSGGAYRSRG